MAFTSSASTNVQPLILTDIPNHSLGNQTQYFIEEKQQLTLIEAVNAHHSGTFRTGKQAALSFGIGSPPVWLALTVNNPTDHVLTYQLATGTTWIDLLDIYILQADGKLIGSVQAGDARTITSALSPGKGYTLSQPFPPGISEIYIHAATEDPLILPITLTTTEQLAHSNLWVQYGYGFMYGYLCALIAYNFMLYSGLRKRSYLYYLLYLTSFIFLNIAYTGHGYSWFWPNSPAIQRYIILALMVLYSACGLVFACRFLTLNQYAPKLLRWIRGFILLGPFLIGITILQDNQLHAAIVAFGYQTVFTLGMVILGVIAVRKKQAVGRYFFTAAFFGMVGTAITTVAVLGWLPFTPLTFHSVNVGILIEATLLALALTHQVREQQNAQTHAEYMAHHDPLTGLLNRRGFYNLANTIWSTAVRKHRPITTIMLDIDYFKQINDEYSHAAGDLTLAKISELLTKESRAGDLVTRWGGEEFLIFLPETSSEQAHILAERIRTSIETLKIVFKQTDITVTISSGIAVRDSNQTLDELIHETDSYLYLAKEQGRNQIYPIV
jgi:diguanylate cyclase (GGDEF)-like protein